MNEAFAVFIAVGGDGIEVTVTLKLTVFEAPTAILPRGMPAIKLPGVGIPSTVMLPLTKVVPGGGVSLNNTLFTGIVPVFVTIAV